MPSLNDAKKVAAYGFRIFPIAAGQKSPPLWSDWPHKSTRTITEWPADANIGIHCEAMAVVDIDKHKGGEDTFTRLAIDHDFPDTLTAVSPRGGRHLFYALPAGHPGVPNRADVLGQGVDVRSTNGYVVAAPSVTADGAYKWLHLRKVAPCPAWLVEQLGTATLRERSEAAKIGDADDGSFQRARDWIKTREGAVEGQGGDQYTFQTACFLRDMGLSSDQAFQVMTLDWNDRCSPPWHPEELERKVKNAYAYAKGEPSAKAVTADDFPTVQESEPFTERGPAPKVDKRPTVTALGAFASPDKGAPYLIKGLLAKGSYSELYGDPGAGKTFVALNLAFHVATGRPWQGRKVRQGLALYLPFEGAGGLRARAQALVQHYKTPDAPLYFAPADFNLREEAGRQVLAAILAELPQMPSLIIIDTFALALKGGDENSAQDVSAFNGAIQALIKATGATVLIIHHCGKDKTRGARGSSALQGAVDTEIMVGSGRITPTKQRDMELGTEFGFKLRSVPVGLDEDDEIITSCIVDDAPLPTEHTNLRPGSNQEMAFNALVELSPNNEPVHRDDWREKCKEFMSPTGFRRAFQQTLTRIKAQHLIEVDDDGYVTRRMTSGEDT